MFKKLSVAFATLAIVIIPGLASAHVVVTPNRAGIGQELVFSISVPNERQSAVTGLKLDIPAGVTEVTPTAMTGWTITQTGNGDAVTAVTWTGTIPAGERQDFSFSAQVPGTAGNLNWKAYQTYADGTVVHWDQAPAGSDDATGNAGPYSVTQVINDLSSTGSTPDTKTNLSGPYALAIVALVFAVLAFVSSRKQH